MYLCVAITIFFRYDMCGWHSDSNPQLGRNPPVASVSLGAVRVFELRKKKGAPNFLRFPLFPGSLLVMEGAVQEDWLHCIPKDAAVQEERVNLTFRYIVHLIASCSGFTFNYVLRTPFLSKLQFHALIEIIL